MHAFYQFLKDLVFPHACLFCAQGDSLVCRECLATIALAPIACPFCGSASADGATCTSCIRHHNLDGCSSLFDYADTKTETIIDALKFKGMFSVCEALERDLFDLCVQIPKIPQEIIWVPAPISITSFIERGYNQSAEIARILAHVSKGKVRDVLTMRGKKIQHTASIRERWDSAQRHILPKRFAKIPSHAMVVDDLKTTGATLDGCAKALKSRGATWVWGVTLASQKKIIT